MFRSKDFILMDVVDIKGKRIGFIKDIIIDFNKGEVKGFVISSYKLLQKTLNVLKEDIISFNKTMVVGKCIKNSFLSFSNIKDIDIVNRNGEIIGMAEDILFHEFTFKIQGLLVSTGFIKNLMSGKKILLMNTIILGEKSILYYSPKNNIEFTSISHRLFVESKCHEKSI